VLNGAEVTEVARRYGVARQTLHAWLRRYAEDGMAALSDRSSKPATCPHQMPPEVEARVCALRREHPGWGPQTILHALDKEQTSPLPSRSAVYRALVRHRLIEPTKRRRQRGDYKRWERSRPMELWQMDVVGGVKLEDGSEASVVTGLDDHSRFCTSARVVARATARPVCDALTEAMGRHGVPENLLTDNAQDLHGALRDQPDLRGPLRPHMQGERDPPPPHGPVLADDHRQGGALPQDAAGRVPQGQGLRQH
jgi:transposase